MADELPEGHIQMADKWVTLGSTTTPTRRRRSAASSEPTEVVEEDDGWVEEAQDVE